MPTTALEGAVRDFCARSEVAPATQRAYSDHLAPLLKWAAAEGIDAADELVPAVVERYASHLVQHRKRPDPGPRQSS